MDELTHMEYLLLHRDLICPKVGTLRKLEQIDRFQDHWMGASDRDRLRSMV